MNLLMRIIRVIACLLLAAVTWLGFTVLSTYSVTGLTESIAHSWGYTHDAWFMFWFSTLEIVYLVLLLASLFIWRKRAKFKPLIRRIERWINAVRALGLALQARLILTWRYVMDSAVGQRVFLLSSYITMMGCYIVSGIVSSLGLVAIVGMLMWPVICLGGYIADHTGFVASMAGIDPLLWKCMFYLVALSPVTIPLRIVVRVWWRLIGNRMFEQQIFTNGHHEVEDEDQGQEQRQSFKLAGDGELLGRGTSR